MIRLFKDFCAAIKEYFWTTIRHFKGLIFVSFVLMVLELVAFKYLLRDKEYPIEEEEDEEDPFEE